MLYIIHYILYRISTYVLRYLYLSILSKYISGILIFIDVQYIYFLIYLLDNIDADKRGRMR